MSVGLQLVLNVNQPPADSAALCSFVFLNSAPNLLLILYAEISPPSVPPSPPERDATLPEYHQRNAIFRKKVWPEAEVAGMILQGASAPSVNLIISSL